VSAAERIAVVGTIATTILGFRGELIKAMVAAGHQVFAFANDYSAETEAEVRALGATPISYNLGRFTLNPLAELKSCYQLYRLFKQLNISLSLCYFAKPVIYGTLAAALAGVPVRVAKIEGLGRTFTIGASGDNLKAKLLRALQVALYRLSLAQTQHVFLLNPDDKADLIDHYRLRCGRISMLSGIGVNFSHYPRTGVPEQPVRFIFVGRLLDEKGIRYYLQAARHIKLLHPDVEFIVLGEPDGKKGVSRAELMQYVDDGIIIYPGRVKQVLPYLQQSSVFVLPSYYREGVPRSTQEAMAVGRAVITTDMPGCRATVRHGVNGFIVPPHDQAALLDAMLTLVRQPELLCPMGEQSYQLAQQRFDAGKINQHIMQVLQLDGGQRFLRSAMAVTEPAAISAEAQGIEQS
jgi:glycosyltransferase involved in cell wall biosynthesis